MARVFYYMKRKVSDHVADLMRMTLDIYDQGKDNDIVRIFSAVRKLTEKSEVEMGGTYCATCKNVGLKIFFDEELQDYQYIVTCKVDGPLYAEGKCEKYDARKESLMEEI